MKELENFKKKTGRTDNIKYSQIRKFKRASTPADLTYRETHMIKGSVWSIQDRDVPFEGGRMEDEFKDYTRPALVTETPSEFGDYELVNVAPGSSHPFYRNNGFRDLVAWVPGEALDRTTYFRVFHRFYVRQPRLLKKLSAISENLVLRLDAKLKEESAK